MLTTRQLTAETPSQTAEINRAAGFVRADIWRRYGSLGTIGKSAYDLKKEINNANLYQHLHLDSQIRQAVVLDVVNDILTYKAAAKVKVRRAIASHTKDEVERKRLYTLLKADEFLTDTFLHRQMRKHFRHGKSSVANQFVAPSHRVTTKVVDGKLTINLLMAKKHYGGSVMLTTTSSGKNVDLSGKNLRIITKDNHTEIHYAYDKPDGRPCGTRTIGVDKGYTEALVDSDGDFHGETFGRVMTEYSNKIKSTNVARNKLHALEKKHRAAGRIAKANRIKLHNLGTKKQTRRKVTTHKHIRHIVYNAVHAVVDKAAVVVSEDLTSPIVGNKNRRKEFNYKMSQWAKGVLAEAIDSVCVQRDAKHVLVNSAYTSQMDSMTGLLEGKRVGDKFYRVNGDVLHADCNAALNVLARLGDSEITRFTSYKEVRRILLARSSGGSNHHPAQPSVNGLELGEQSRQPSADKSTTVSAS